MLICIASPADAAALAQIAEKSFRQAFEAQNSVADMDLYCRSHFSEAMQASEIAATDGATLLIKHHGELAGFSQLRWGSAPDCVSGPAPGEIARFYLLREFHGTGVALPLMQNSLEALQSQGCKTAWLGVWQENPRAIAFYRKHGFREVGEQIFVLGNDHQRDFVLARSLTEN